MGFIMYRWCVVLAYQISRGMTAITGPDLGWLVGSIYRIPKRRYFEPVLDPYFDCIQRSCGIKGGSVGGPKRGLISAILCSNQLSPTRARAYNDLHKDAVLLKTASKWLQGYPWATPKWVPILGPTDRHVHTVIQFIRAYPCIQCTCKHDPEYTPPKWGPFWGSYR